MRWYFLAFIIWIVIIVLCLTIIGIPIVVYLKDRSQWFDAPFDTAYCYNCHY